MDRIPPHNLEAEMAVIGSILVQASIMDTLAPILRPDHFYAHVHESIWTALLALYHEDKPLDKLSLCERLRSMGVLDKVGGPSYMSKMMDTVQTARSAKYYAEIVREKSILRGLIKAGSYITQLGFEAEEDVPSALEDAMRTLEIVSEARIETGASASVAAQRYAEVLNEVSKHIVFTPFESLNRLTAGFKPGDIQVLAAASKAGKTTFLIILAVYISMKYGHVAFFGMEEGEFSSVQRFVGLLSGVSPRRQLEGVMAHYNNGELVRPLDDWEKERVNEALLVLSGLPITIFDEPLKPEEVVAHCRRLNRDNKLRFVIVDTLKSMKLPKAKGQSETSVLEEAVKTLKQGSQHIQAPLIVTHHFNRGNRQNGRPTADNLRDGGNLDGWASNILILHREDDGTLELIVERSRMGVAGTIKMKNDLALGMWWEASNKDPWTPLGPPPEQPDMLSDADLEHREIL